MPDIIPLDRTCVREEFLQLRFMAFWLDRNMNESRQFFQKWTPRKGGNE